MCNMNGRVLQWRGRFSYPIRKGVNPMKKTLLCLLLCLMLALPALAEAPAADVVYATPEEEIAALQGRIAELEAIIANLEERLSRYESVLAVSVDPNADVIVFDGGSVKASVAQAEFDETSALYDEFGLSPAEYAEDLKTDILTTLAEEAVLAYHAQQLGLYENTPEQQLAAEEEAEATYESAIAYYLPYFTGDDISAEDARAQAEAYIATEGITREYLLEDTLRAQWQQRLYDAVTADVTVTDEAIRALYDNGLAAAKELYTDPAMYEFDYLYGEMIYTHPEGYREVEYIAMSFTEEELALSSEERMASLSARYADLLARAANGESLMALSEEYMLFDSGVLAVSETAMMMPENFNAVAMALELNELSTLVESDGGAWLIRHTAAIPAGDVPFETMQAQLAEAAIVTARDDAFNAIVEQWITDANIITYPDLIQ